MSIWFHCAPEVVALPPSCAAFAPRCRVADDEIEITLAGIASSRSIEETRRAFGVVVSDLVCWRPRGETRVTVLVTASADGVNVDDFLLMLKRAGFNLGRAPCSTIP